jgi:hypothetical protein
VNSLLPKSSKVLCDGPGKDNGWCKFRAKWAHSGPFSLCGFHERQLSLSEYVKLGDGSLAVQKDDGSTYIEGKRRFDRKGRPFVRPGDGND